MRARLEAQPAVLSNLFGRRVDDGPCRHGLHRSLKARIHLLHELFARLALADRVLLPLDDGPEGLVGSRVPRGDVGLELGHLAGVGLDRRLMQRHSVLVGLARVLPR